MENSGLSVASAKKLEDPVGDGDGARYMVGLGDGKTLGGVAEIEGVKIGVIYSEADAEGEVLANTEGTGVNEGEGGTLDENDGVSDAGGKADALIVGDSDA